MEHIISEGFRPGTKRNLKSQLNNYYQFCESFHLTPVPANTTQLSRFAVYLHKFKLLKPTSIDNNVTAVRTLHGLLELPVPETSTYIHQAVIRGLKARNKVPVKKATPMDPEVFKLILPFVNFKDPLELVTWVALLMGFHLLLRVSNITSASRNKFNPQEGLMRKDFRMHRGIMLVHIRWSKTLQYQERKLLIPVIPFVDAELSAVKWFEYMINKIPAGPASPAFAVPTKTKKGIQLLPLSYSQLSRLLKKWTRAAGLGRPFSSHSLRRGGACWLKKKGSGRQCYSSYR